LLKNSIFLSPVHVKKKEFEKNAVVLLYKVFLNVNIYIYIEEEDVKTTTTKKNIPKILLDSYIIFFTIHRFYPCIEQVSFPHIANQ
jgi:hypothetical protein